MRNKQFEWNVADAEDLDEKGKETEDGYLALDVSIPDPMNSLQKWERHYHADIPNLEDTELYDELNTLRPLLWGLPSDDWRRERVKRLQVEALKRRKERGGHA